MTVTIEVDGSLAAQLQTKAADRQVSPQEFACALLNEALRKMDESEQWDAQNQRRIALIKKSSGQALSQADTNELQMLQDAADQRLEARDSQLLDTLNQLKQAVRNLPDDDKTE